MAVLNSIRKRGVFLILIIALALFSFILSDIINKGSSAASVQNVVATVNGTEILREDFMTQVDEYQRNLGPNAAASQAMNLVWDRQLKSLLYDQQVKALGLTISEEQLNDQLRMTLANNPTFQDENGLYSDARLLEYMAAIQNNARAKQQWDTFLKGVRESLGQSTYATLVASGMEVSMADGEQLYRFENDKIDIEYLHVPYSSIADEDVTVSESEIKTYIREHAQDFEVDPMVDLEYVIFEESASNEDMEAQKEDLTALIDGFNAADDVAFYVNDNSDQNFVDQWVRKEGMAQILRDSLLALPEGDVYGPYRDGSNFKLSKVVATMQMPDSVEARHILIPVGLSRADSITRSPAEALAFADSLYAELKKNRRKFADFVRAHSSDLGSVEKGGHYDYFGYNTMVAPFRDFCFEGRTGDLGVVESQFGVHIIEIEGQKEKSTAYKVATISREIEPSEATLSLVFSESAKFEEAARNEGFSVAADQKGLTPRPVNRIGALDANIPGIGNNRSIINWAFQGDVAVGDVKRFNLNESYVVAQVTRKSTEKALMSVAEASATVTPILRKQKKAQMIRQGLSGTTLQELASSQNVTVKTASALTRATPTIAGAGTEPVVVGAAFGVGALNTTELIDGETGVFKVRVLSEQPAVDLENYSSYVNQIKSGLLVNAINTRIFNALKAIADIEDNRADFY
ncbi:MAG: SurA N-terminal domain-containing protein [Bacteroidetes bacterium]|nr:SurA N-terminal domain-containing protein [Flavobacteriaceae bacterium]MDA0864764.1 SurA N-terminal domain-containing protein [Bacteroidota bacterium]